MRRVLRADGRRGEVRIAGRTILVTGQRPTDVAFLLMHTPGVSWIAAGYEFHTSEELSNAVSRLARAYVRKGTRFSSSAESSSPEFKASDLSGAVNSVVIDAAEDVRVDERKPEVRFRVARDRKVGAVGVQVVDGPGGRPVGNRRVYCLVSGGKHSSALVWAGLLSGLSVEMVHVETEDSLLQVARLCAELYQRVDYTKLGLTVLRGGGAAWALREWLKEGQSPVYGGWHSECHQKIPLPQDAVQAPLFIMNEEYFDSVMSELSLMDTGAKAVWGTEGKRLSVRRFAGKRADVHEIIDRLREE